MKSQKGRRSRYAYGTTVKVYKGVAYTLDADEQLGMAFNGQLGRNGRSPLRQAALKADNQSSQKAISANNVNRIHSPHYAGEVKIIDESLQRAGAKTFRLLPYQSARREHQHIPRAGFVMERKISYDQIKVVKNVNLGAKDVVEVADIAEMGNRKAEACACERSRLSAKINLMLEKIFFLGIVFYEYTGCEYF